MPKQYLNLNLSIAMLFLTNVHLILNFLSLRFARLYLDVGSRTDSRGTFHCFASAIAPTLLYLLHPCSRKKSAQKKGDSDAASLRAKAFVGGRQKGPPATLPTRGIHTATLTVYSRRKLRCSARHTREKPGFATKYLC